MGGKIKSALSVIFLFLVGLSISGCNSGGVSNNSQPPNSPSAEKKWQQMSETEKSDFIKTKSNEILTSFGRTEGDEIDENGLKRIQTFIDSYLKRIDAPKSNDCKQPFRNDLTSVLERRNKTVPAIQKGFSANKLPVQIGLYVAMIETEFCPCLQAPTGSLGMFQLTAAKGQEFGIKTVKGANPANPDERCDVEKASFAASNYFQKMTEKGLSPDSIGRVLAISAFNSGEALAQKQIELVRNKTKDDKISFWKMSSYLEKNKDGFSKEEQHLLQQFWLEGAKYVPKFFAAAIIGENPQAFGINIEPLSKTAK